MEGKTLPEFSLQMPDSTTWINTKDIKTGKPVVFFLFSPYCPHCKSQITKIVDDIELLKDISIYMITPLPLREMKQFYSTYKLSQYPNIQVGRDTADFFGQYMNVKGIPFLALYDKNKRLARAFSGTTSTHLIKAIIAD
jgi:thiol-disulfide isomerase/thioredoxin